MSSETERDVPRKIGVLFVCLGNICRSPLAKWLFVAHAAQRGVLDQFDIDSCGTGAWHVGKDADPRSIAVAAANDVRFDHVARQLDAQTDFRRFGIIIPMDRSNKRNIMHAGESAGLTAPQLTLMRAYDPTLTDTDERELDVPDPYYGGPEGFQHMYDMLDRAAQGLLNHLLQNKAPR
jgi:protein-tyrosine phosphatase